jgi:hypothetical protein
MNFKKLLAILIPAVLICAFGATLLIFFSPGYHTLFGWHRFNIDGPCMVYDLQTQKFREDTTLHIHECQRAVGEVRKGQFIVEGYLDTDVDVLNQSAEEGTFFTHASYYGAYGSDSLNCIVTKYTMIQGREPEVASEVVYPCAILNYDRKKNVCKITLYQRGDNGEREDLYIIYYGFSNREDAEGYGDMARK